MMKRGLIALDIDGTLTNDWHELPGEVADYLHSLYDMGFVIAIFTGRPYRFAEPILKKMSFPFYAALQNGAIILEAGKIVKKHYLPAGHLPELDQICSRFGTSFVIYAGLEYRDQCFFRPRLFSKKELAYINARAAGLNEVFVEMESFQELEGMEFPSYKCFGSGESIEALAAEIRRLGMHVPVIADRFDQNFLVAQMTRAGVDKGSALRDCQELAKVQGPVIAAGDDFNDWDMLAKADVKIVMATAPEKLKSLADIIAPPAAELGIIEGLKACVNKF